MFKSLKFNRLVEIYTNVGEDNFSLGFVLAFNENYLLLQSVSPYGEESGIYLYCINEIVKVETNTLYCKKIKKLISIKNTKFPKYKNINEDFMLWLLQNSKTYSKIIQVQLLQSNCCDVMGIVKELTNDTCLIAKIDHYGFKDGISEIKIADISSIKYDDIESRDLERFIKL